MSVNTLVEFFTDPTEGQYLNENFLDQWFTGKDEEKLEEFRARIRAGFKSEREKNHLLDQIDDAIDNSNRIITVSSISDFAGQILSGLAFNIPMLIRIIIRASNGNERKDVRDALYAFRQEIQKAPIKK